MCKKKINVISIFLQQKTDFQAFFQLFKASIRSRPPGPPPVPGVLSYCCGRKVLSGVGHACFTSGVNTCYIPRTASAHHSSPPGVPVTRLQPHQTPSVPRTRGVWPAVSASCVLSQEGRGWARDRKRFNI